MREQCEAPGGLMRPLNKRKATGTIFPLGKRFICQSVIPNLSVLPFR